MSSSNNIDTLQNDCIASTDVTVTHANGLPVWITTDYKLTSSAVNSRGGDNKVAKDSDGDGYVRYYLVANSSKIGSKMYVGVGTWRSRAIC